MTLELAKLFVLFKLDVERAEKPWLQGDASARAVNSRG
jgi:hypothetical protein